MKTKSDFHQKRDAFLQAALDLLEAWPESGSVYLESYHAGLNSFCTQFEHQSNKEIKPKPKVLFFIPE